MQRWLTQKTISYLKYVHVSPLDIENLFILHLLKQIRSQILLILSYVQHILFHLNILIKNLLFCTEIKTLLEIYKHKQTIKANQDYFPQTLLTTICFIKVVFLNYISRRIQELDLWFRYQNWAFHAFWSCGLYVSAFVFFIDCLLTKVWIQYEKYGKSW